MQHHHWANCFQTIGIEVRLVSPRYVAPFVKTNKNDRNDADVIIEAASRPTMRFATIKRVQACASRDPSEQMSHAYRSPKLIPAGCPCRDRILQAKGRKAVVLHIADVRIDRGRAR